MKARYLGATAFVAVLALMMAPSQAASAYHMNGQGSITMSGPGIPACAAVAPQGCATQNPNQAFSWGALTVQGAGPLQNEPVAGQYRCASEGSVGGSAFESRIYGNTTNFQLTFNFQCTRTTGAGPAYINGWFSNVADQAVANLHPAYHIVSSHPHPGPVVPGTFVFKGFFSVTNTHPYGIGATNGAPMTCGGGFAPTGMNDTYIKTAAFLGACTALSGA